MRLVLDKKKKNIYKAQWFGNKDLKAEQNKTACYHAASVQNSLKNERSMTEIICSFSLYFLIYPIYVGQNSPQRTALTSRDLVWSLENIYQRIK